MHNAIWTFQLRDKIRGQKGKVLMATVNSSFMMTPYSPNP